MSILNVTGGAGCTGGDCAAATAAATYIPTIVAGSRRLSFINRLSIFLELRASRGEVSVDTLLASAQRPHLCSNLPLDQSTRASTRSQFMGRSLVRVIVTASVFLFLIPGI